jgi:hypothetical protein
MDTVSLPGFLASLLLPWLLGYFVVSLLIPQQIAGRSAISIGCGYLAGLFATTLVLRLYDSLGLTLNFIPLAILLAGLIALLALAHGRASNPYRKVAVESPTPRWEYLVIVLLLILIGLRYWTILAEVSLRPLYPWDAFMNWAPKAVTWFHYKSLVPFVNESTWLANTGDPGLHTIRAHSYPETVPLVLLWHMLGVGTADHTFPYLSWPLLALTSGIAMYGFMRFFAFSRMAAILYCYAVLSIPYINLHVTLAGYADIWLTFAFTLAVLSLHSWQRSGDKGFAVLALLFSVACTQIKTPGIVLGGIGIATLMVAALQIRISLLVIAGLFLTLTVVILILFGVELNLPLLGEIKFSKELIRLPGLGAQRVEFHNSMPFFGESLFLQANWNILGYALTAALLLILVRYNQIENMDLLLANVVLASVFIFVTYSFTSHYDNAVNFTSLNRVLLYIMPVATLICFLAFRIASEHPVKAEKIASQSGSQG